MGSQYPDALDSIATNKSNQTRSVNDHPQHHDQLADAVNKIEAELGVNPSGAEATVGARLNGLDSNRFFAAADGVKADGKTVTDAAINSGSNQLSSPTAAADWKKDQLVVVMGAGTPKSATTSGATGVAAITSIPVNALAADIPPGGIKIDDGAGHSQKFVTSGALAGATSIPLIGPLVGGLTSALSTGGPITALPVAPLNFALPAGTVTIVSVGAGGVLHTQTFTTTGAVVGATSIPVTSATPNFAYPESATVFGSPANFVTADKPTPTFNFPSGSTIKTDVPALSTTIASVNGGVATLAANAGTTVAGAECFFGTDNLAALNVTRGKAEVVGGSLVLPEGDIAISGPFASSAAIAIRGQGVRELYGGTGAANDANWPSVAPYLRGSVLVQCAPNADVIQCTSQGRAQDVRGVGLRFAGKFLNTGHGINNASAVGGLSSIDSVIEDVKVYGHDGNHYAFLMDSPELHRWVGLRWYGGGGIWLKTNATIPGPPGNITSVDCNGATFVAGIAQGVLLDASGAPSLLAFDSNLFENLEMGVRIPNPAIPNVTPPWPGGVQNCIRAINAEKQTLTGFVLPGGESDPARGINTWPNGPGCWRTNDFNAAFAKGSQDTPGNPSSGTGLQNRVGKPLVAMHQFNFKPAAAATASTTLNGATGSGATNLLVASSAGFSVGQGIQIGPDANGDIEYAIVSVIPDGTHITIQTPGVFGLIYPHATGAPVQAGAAVMFAQVSSSNAWPGWRWAFDGVQIGQAHTQRSYVIPLPASYWLRLDWANADRMWTDYAGSFG